MLVLKINTEKEFVKKRKGVFSKKSISVQSNGVVRSTVNINGVKAIVMELPLAATKTEEFNTLLKMYSGRLLCANTDNDNSHIINADYLFSPKAYYQRALLSSLVNQVKIISADCSRVCMKVEAFFICKELYSLVKVFKDVTINTKPSALTTQFVSQCYNDFGAIVKIKSDYIALSNTVLVDLDKADEKGRLIINACGKEYFLYPDSTYFECNAEYNKLQGFNIDYNLLCAAFSGK